MRTTKAHISRTVMEELRRIKEEEKIDKIGRQLEKMAEYSKIGRGYTRFTDGFFLRTEVKRRRRNNGGF